MKLSFLIAHCNKNTCNSCLIASWQKTAYFWYWANNNNMEAFLAHCCLEMVACSVLFVTKQQNEASLMILTYTFDKDGASYCSAPDKLILMTLRIQGTGTAASS